MAAGSVPVAATRSEPVAILRDAPCGRSSGRGL